MNNVAGEAKYAKVKARMSADLMEKLKAAHDPRVSNDIIFEKPPYTNGPKYEGKDLTTAKPVNRLLFMVPVVLVIIVFSCVWSFTPIT